jgi:hypothetical protein
MSVLWPDVSYRKATITHIRSSTVGVDYFLHKDMEELLRIYNKMIVLKDKLVPHQNGLDS